MIVKTYFDKEKKKKKLFSKRRVKIIVNSTRDRAISG